MSNSLTQNILQYLLANQVIDSVNPSDSGWIGVQGFYETPDRVVSVIHAGGRDPNPAWNLDYPHMQIIVRTIYGDYAGLEAKTWEIRKALLGVANYHVPGTDDIWASIRVIGDMIPIGPDQNGRERMSLNLEMIVHTGDLGHRSDIA